VTFAGGYFELFLWALAVVAWRLTAPGTLTNYLAHASRGGRLHGRAAVAGPGVGGVVRPALGGGAGVRVQAVHRHRVRRVLRAAKAE